jgi:glycine cleavage system aminomethyltransferase T
MQKVCCNNINVEDGKVVYTGFLNPRGGFETDVTVTRQNRDTFFVVCPTAHATKDMHWLKKNADIDEFVTFTDVTSAYSVLNIQGPDSEKLLT